jgi:hypothetical protein
LDFLGFVFLRNLWVLYEDGDEDEEEKGGVKKSIINQVLMVHY